MVDNTSRTGINSFPHVKCVFVLFGIFPIEDCFAHLDYQQIAKMLVKEKHNNLCVCVCVCVSVCLSVCLLCEQIT